MRGGKGLAAGSAQQGAPGRSGTARGCVTHQPGLDRHLLAWPFGRLADVLAFVARLLAPGLASGASAAR